MDLRINLINPFIVSNILIYRHPQKMMANSFNLERQFQEEKQKAVWGVVIEFSGGRQKRESVVCS